MDREQLSTAWGAIKLVHYRSQDPTQPLTTTFKNIGQRCDQANKCESYKERNSSEVKKLGSYSRNEFQILKETLNQINNRVSSMEAGTHPAIYWAKISIQDLTNFNIWESGLYYFGKDLQTMLVP